MCWSTLQNIQTSSTSTQCCNEVQKEEKQKDSVLLQQKSSFRRWRYNCFMLCFSLIIKSPRQSQTQYYGFRHKLYNIEEFCKSVTIRQNLFKVKAWMWWKLCVGERVLAAACHRHYVTRIELCSRVPAFDQYARSRSQVTNQARCHAMLQASLLQCCSAEQLLMKWLCGK